MFMAILEWLQSEGPEKGPGFSEIRSPGCLHGDQGTPKPRECFWLKTNGFKSKGPEKSLGFSEINGPGIAQGGQGEPRPK